MLNQFELAKSAAPEQANEHEHYIKQLATSLDAFSSNCLDFGIYPQVKRHFSITYQVAFQLLNDVRQYYGKSHLFKILATEKHNTLRECVLWILDSPEFRKHNKRPDIQYVVDDVKKGIADAVARENNHKAGMADFCAYLTRTPNMTT